MYLIAHRGKINKLETGNTRESIFHAYTLPYIYGIECDVRLTKDKEIVLIHDPIIDFVSNGTGIVKFMTLKELQKYQFGSKENPESVFTLKELLENSITTKTIFIELKGEEKEIVEKVGDLILKYSNLNIVVISFSYSLLKEFQKKYPVIKTGLLIGYQLNQKYIYNHFTYNLFTYHYLAFIHMNKNLIYFTINERKKIEKLKNEKKDIMIITDKASLFREMI